MREQRVAIGDLDIPSLFLIELSYQFADFPDQISLEIDDGPLQPEADRTRTVIQHRPPQENFSMERVIFLPRLHHFPGKIPLTKACIQGRLDKIGRGMSDIFRKRILLAGHGPHMGGTDRLGHFLRRF